MPEIGHRFLNFFLGTDDFSTYKKNNDSLIELKVTLTLAMQIL